MAVGSTLRLNSTRSLPLLILGGLGCGPGETPAELAARMRDALVALSGRLLIFDNAADLGAAAEFLPVAVGGHALVT